MPDKVLKAQLIAGDQMSAVLKKAGDSAKTLGESLEKTGTAGKDAAKRLETAQKSSQTLGRSLEQTGRQAQTFRQSFEESARAVEANNQKYEASNKIMRDIGISAGIVTAAVGLASQSYRNQEIALNTLERSYLGATGEMRSFTDQIQDTTNFSNDAAIRSANLAATLVRNYGFTQQEVQQVLQISADLAAANGYTMEDATYRVVAALRGEAEAAEQLGLTMNQQNIDRQNLTLTMSNEEAGHYRLNALIEQSAYAQGAAAEQAKGLYGELVQGRDVLQDWSQTLGGSLGPLGEFGAFAADNAVQVGAMSVAIGQLVTTGSKIKDITTQMGGAANAAKSLGAVIGPGGVLLAAAAGAEVAFLALKHVFGEDLGAGVDEASQDFDRIIQKIIQVKEAAGLTEGQADLVPVVRQANELLMDQADILDAVNTAMADLTPTQAALFDENHDGTLTTDEYTRSLGTLNQTLAENKDAVAALRAIAPYVDESLSAIGAGSDEYQQGIADLTGEILAGNVGQKEAIATAQDLEQTYYDTALATEAATDGVINLGDMLVTTSGQMITGSESAEKYSAALGDVGLQGRLLAGNLSFFGEKVAHNTKDVDENREAWEKWKAELDSSQYVAMLQHDSLDAASRGLDAVTVAINTAQGALNNLDFTPLRDFGAEFTIDFGVSLGKFDVEAARDRIIDALGDIATAPEALDSAFRVIVSNTDAIGKSAQQVQDWADKLIGAAGTYATIDDLLQRGTISMDEYTAAQAAYTPIAEANARIQDNILAIQADQAPVLADLMQTTDAYIAHIRELDGVQQTAALGFLDTGESAEALKLKMLALDAASGQLGQDGAKWATGIIVGAAEADPVLASMLLSMGLISEEIDASGNKTYTVNLDDQATDPLMKLVDVTERLAYTQILLSVGVTNVDEARRIFQELFGHAAEWDDTTSTATLGANSDPALGKIGEAQNTLADWDRTTGTGTVDADNSGAMGTLGEAMNALADWDRSTGTATMNVNDNATGTAALAIALVHQFDGLNATATLTTYYNSVGAATAHDLGFRHGGVPGYAHGGTVGDYLPNIPSYATGGVVAELAENGPERLYFANGGTAMVYDRGYYPIPEHTYVSPTNAVGSGGDPVIHVEFSGNFIHTSRDDLRAWAQEEFIPSLRRVIQDARRGQPS